MEYLSFLIASFLGFGVFHLATNDSQPIRKNMPNVKVWRVQLFPIIRFYLDNRIIWFHHWFNFTILLLISIFFISGGILDATYTKGFLLGGILQGLSMRQTRHLIHQKEEKIGTK